MGIWHGKSYECKKPSLWHTDYNDRDFNKGTKSSFLVWVFPSHMWAGDRHLLPICHHGNSNFSFYNCRHIWDYIFSICFLAGYMYYCMRTAPICPLLDPWFLEQCLELATSHSFGWVKFNQVTLWIQKIRLLLSNESINQNSKLSSKFQGNHQFQTHWNFKLDFSAAFQASSKYYLCCCSLLIFSHLWEGI